MRKQGASKVSNMVSIAVARLAGRISGSVESTKECCSGSMPRCLFHKSHPNPPENHSVTQSVNKAKSSVALVTQECMPDAM